MTELKTGNVNITVETEHGPFEIVKNYREAFNLVKFNERYVEEVFGQYAYIVGDVSSEILRLKAFSGEITGLNSYKHIPDYLNEYCNYNIAYYILRNPKIDVKLEEKVSKPKKKKRKRGKKYDRKPTNVPTSKPNTN